MMVRVALMSGGKDSFYAAMRVGKVDLALMLIYEAPQPSPHVVNLGKSIETILNSGIPVVTLRLKKGRERSDLVNFLSKLHVNEIIAGDVYIEDHLKYMESIANELGAKLIEPLWGEDPQELMVKIFKSGIEATIIGVIKELRKWLGFKLTSESLNDFMNYCKELNIDPLGEHGEYHTIVVNSPLHIRPLSLKILGIEEFNQYSILRLV